MGLSFIVNWGNGCKNKKGFGFSVEYFIEVPYLYGIKFLSPATMDYSFFKLIHLTAVMLFLGNIITGLFWMQIAVKTKDVKIIGHTIRGIIKSDKYFTIPGVIIITFGGIMAATQGNFPILKTGWILWSIILFSLSGLVFSFMVAPLQKKINSFVRDNAAFGDSDWTEFRRLYFLWDISGLIALVTPLAAFVMMVLKIPH
jgi:uncharacterized membrane protein